MFPALTDFRARPLPFDAKSGVCLASAHLWVRKEIADRIFGSRPVAVSVFYPSQRMLLVGGIDNTLFMELHNVTPQLVKAMNARGDKWLSLHDVPLDHDVDGCDRDLEFVFEESLTILKIKL